MHLFEIGGQGRDRVRGWVRVRPPGTVRRSSRPLALGVGQTGRLGQNCISVSHGFFGQIFRSDFRSDFRSNFPGKISGKNSNPSTGVFPNFLRGRFSDFRASKFLRFSRGEILQFRRRLLLPLCGWGIFVIGKGGSFPIRDGVLSSRPKVVPVFVRYFSSSLSLSS